MSQTDPTSIHAGRPAVVLGAGPSLIDFDFDRLGDAVVFSVNRMAEVYPAADYLTFVDLSYFHHNGGLRNLVEDFAGQVLAPRGFGKFFKRDLIEFDQIVGGKPEFRWPRIWNGTKPAGTAPLAAALAFVLGCSPIYLLGWDYRIARDERTHCHGGGRLYCQADLDNLARKAREVITSLWRRGANIINVTPCNHPHMYHDGSLNYGPFSRLGWGWILEQEDFDLRKGVNYGKA